MKVFSVRRFAALGAVALPLVMGSAAFADNNPVVAKVGGQEIRLSVVQEQFENLQANQPQIAALPLSIVYEQVLESVVNAQVVTEAGLKAGLDKDPVVLKDLELLKKQLVANAYMEKTVDAKVTDAEIKKRYDELKAAFKPEPEIHARHILLETEDQANAMIERLNKGEDFQKLADENTTDPSGKGKGGDLGFFTKERMIPAFAEAAFAMKAGTISDKPVQTDFGWHVIRVEERRDTTFPELDKIKPQIRNQLAGRVIEEEFARLKKSANIELFTMEGKPLVNEPPATEPTGATPAP